MSSLQWHHAPAHLLVEQGVYMVTAGTLHKQHFFTDKPRLDCLQDNLLAVLAEYGWQPHAWAIFSNHYHFVALSPEQPETLRRCLNKLHTVSAKEINRLDGCSGRRVWHQFWDTRLTYERAYLARLHYVQENPVRHGMVKDSVSYPWCSKSFFIHHAPASFQKTVGQMPIDRLKVQDDF